MADEFFQSVADDAAYATKNFTKASFRATMTLAVPILEMGILAFLVIAIVSAPARLLRRQ
jgi:hypothetical protein